MPIFTPSPLRERVGVRVMTQISRAKELRKQSTDAERLLWSRLRNRSLLGLKFKRQSPIGRYIVDFVCRERNLIIEIDGGHHQELQASDEIRTAFLISCGFRVIRYWNNEVLEDVKAGKVAAMTKPMRIREGRETAHDEENVR